MTSTAGSTTTRHRRACRRPEIRGHSRAYIRRDRNTSVCEFHYLHNDADGRPYADDATLARCLVRAARRAGIGLTLLPVLYERAGFEQPTLRNEQRRFATSAEQVWSPSYTEAVSGSPDAATASASGSGRSPSPNVSTVSWR